MSLHRVTSVLAVSPHPVFDFLTDNSAPCSRGDRDGATMTAECSPRSGGPSTHGRSRNQVSSRKRVPTVEARRIIPTGRGGDDAFAGAYDTIHRLGHFALRYFHCRVRLFGTESRTGDGIGNPDFDSGDWSGPSLSATVESAGERDHHRHRRGCWVGGGRRRVHGSGVIHSEARPS